MFYMEFSKHMLYILYNETNNATYNGYTVDTEKRIRQHNGEIKGGARYTSQQVKTMNVKWLPLAFIRVPIDSPDYDHRRALSIEWSIKYCDNHRPRPSKYNGHDGRLIGLGLVFDNPKFSDLSFHVTVFSQRAFDVLSSSLSETARVVVDYKK